MFTFPKKQESFGKFATSFPNPNGNISLLPVPENIETFHFSYFISFREAFSENIKSFHPEMFYSKSIGLPSAYKQSSLTHLKNPRLCIVSKMGLGSCLYFPWDIVSHNVK